MVLCKKRSGGMAGIDLPQIRADFRIKYEHR